MSYAKTSTGKLNENIVFSFLKGLIISILISFALIILLAFSLKWFSLDEKYISPLNLVIKTVSVLIGSFVAIKGENKGLIKGVVFGLIYILSAFLSFSLLSNSFNVNSGLLLDILFACIAGGLVGIIKVNAR